MSTCCSSGTVAPAEKAPAPEKKKAQEASVPTPATIVVALPEDANLTFDGNATTSTSARRVFVTPALPTGSTYTYTLRAVIGDAVQTQVVNVRAGETTDVSFTFASQGVASR